MFEALKRQHTDRLAAQAVELAGQMIKKEEEKKGDTTAE